KRCVPWIRSSRIRRSLSEQTTSSSCFAASSRASTRKSRSAIFSQRQSRSRTPRPSLELSSWRKMELAALSPLCTASCKTRATPGKLRLAYVDGFVEKQRLLPAEAAGHSDEQTAYLRRMGHVGRRVAELQLALASRNDIVAFAPEPIAADDVRRWTEAILQRAGRALGELARRRSDLAQNDRQLVDALLSYRDSLPARLRELLPEPVDAMKSRHP